jgi:hypothetical protein
MVTILPKDEFKSSTITMVATLNSTIDAYTVADYLPVTHLYDANGKHIRLDSGTRDGIKFFGINGVIITSCYKDIRRGIRTGAMNNMICLDLQVLGRNVHIKLSDNIITSVGTCGYESGKYAFNCMIEHLNLLKKNIDYFQSLPLHEQETIYRWITQNCIRDGKLKRLSEITTPSHIDSHALGILLVYIDDFEVYESEKYLQKIKKLSKLKPIFGSYLTNVEPKIYNSVYHIKLCTGNKRLALHKMAPYLYDKGISVEFHNWTSEGVNICFPIDNNHELNSQNKVYKHRFTVHERSSMRQCSPAFKQESYKYYVEVMNLISEFIDNGQRYDDFTNKYLIIL